MLNAKNSKEQGQNINGIVIDTKVINVDYEPKVANGSYQYACLPSQVSMFFSSNQSLESNCAFTQAFRIELIGDYDAAILEAALEALPVLHSGLLSVFSEDGKSASVDPSRSAFVERVFLQNVSFTERDIALEKVNEAYVTVPFDLREGPLFKASIIEISSDHCVIFIAAHHCVCDGWSLDVLLDDFGKIYTAMRGLCPFPNPDRPIPPDFLNYVGSDRYTEQKAKSLKYWQRQFHDSLPSVGSVQSDKARKSVTFVNDAYNIVYGREVVQLVDSYGKKRGFSTFVVLLSAFYHLIYRLSGEKRLAIAVPVARHLESGMENAVGDFVNFVPVICEIDPNKDFLSLCKTVHDKLLDAQDHGSWDVDELVQQLGLENETAKNLKLFQFVPVHKYSAEELRFGNAEVMYSGVPKRFDHFPMTVFLYQSENEFELKIGSSIKFNNGGQVDSWFKTMESFLVNACLHPNQPLNEIKAEVIRLSTAGSDELDIKEQTNVVVPLNRSKSNNSIFFVCGIALYAPLAKNLEDQFSCYGVYVPEEEGFLNSEDGGQTLSVSELASLYIKAIKSHSPKGPYTVAGISFGGIMAYEVTRQLSQLGDEVSSCIIMDAILPGALKRDLLKTLYLCLDQIRKEGLSLFLKEKIDKLLPDKRLKRISSSSKDSGNANKDREERNLQLWNVVKRRSTMRYLCSGLKNPVPCILIRATERSGFKGFYMAPDLDWGRRISGPLVLADAPGSHLGIIRSLETANIITKFSSRI